MGSSDGGRVGLRRVGNGSFFLGGGGGGGGGDGE